MRARSLLLLAALLMFACGGKEETDGGTPPTDAGTDAGVDAGEEDAGPEDAGMDAGPTDAGPTDAGEEDGGVTDAGPTDAGPTDGGGGVHPAGWANPAQHGQAFLTSGPAACTSCHGADLMGSGAAVSCDTCHSGWQTNCTFCHGGVDNQTGAPPIATNGATAVTDPSVGQHTAHVEQTDVHGAYDCSTCHTTPDSVLSAGHIDGSEGAEVVFGSLNPSATYDPNTSTCASLYCHGNGSQDNGEMVWTSTPTLDCTSCHGQPPSTGRHTLHVSGQNLACQQCHSATVDASNAIIDPTLHVNGTANVNLQLGGTYDPATGSCSPACHGTETW